jgi:hypothetical protein
MDLRAPAALRHNILVRTALKTRSGWVGLDVRRRHQANLPFVPCDIVVWRNRHKVWSDPKLRGNRGNPS